jgi:NAD(P)-dependent dehydrogenase (short-subunit alcohol dehydrogenase family)
MDYLEAMFDLSGKTAVVTGGAGAIGTVMSDALLRAGANVVVWSRTNESIASFLARYKDLPELRNRVHGIQLDTGNEEAVADAFARSAATFSLPEILVNGVGGNKGKTVFLDIDVDQFKDILNMNLLAGLVVPTKLFCRHWIKEGIKGTIINLTSMTSYNPLSGVWAYDAAKAATLNLTMACANEFAPHGIRVNAIAPGFFIGKQNKALLIDEKTGEYTARGQAVLSRTPFQRFGEVSELAGTTIYLASSRASGFVTGVSIPVDGGYLVHNI